MQSKRRTLVALAALAALAIPFAAPAQDFPNKAIKIIVPLAAGGTGDTLARTVPRKLLLSSMVVKEAAPAGRWAIVA